MTIINFEELIEKDPDAGHNEVKANQYEESQSYQKREINAKESGEPHCTVNKQALGEAEAFYREVYEDKKRIDLLKKRCDQLVEKAKLHIVEIVGHRPHTGDDYELEQITPQGSVDWKRLEETFPGLKVNPFRKVGTTYWRLKFKQEGGKPHRTLKKENP